MDIIIRNVDPAAISKIDDIVKKRNRKSGKKMSREAYLRGYINSLAVLPEIRDTELKYEALVKEVLSILEDNTRTIKGLDETIMNSHK